MNQKRAQKVVGVIVIKIVKWNEMERKDELTYAKGGNNITKYVTVSDPKKGVKEKMSANNTNPLEDNWELATRIREILSENSEKWKVSQKEKDEMQRKIVEKGGSQ